MTGVRPLRVALPTSTFLPSLGGVEVGLHNIASRLASRGHQPCVMAPASNVAALRREGRSFAYRLIAFPPKTLTLTQHAPGFACWALARYFGWLQARHRFDVWHGTVGYPVGTALARFAGGRVANLVRCAGDDIQTLPEIGYGMRLDPRKDQQIRTWLPRADRLVAISQSVADEYRALGVDPSRIAHIPNGVELARFRTDIDRAAIRRAHGLPADRFLFLSVGRSHPKKGFSDLVRAAAVLSRLTAAPFVVAIAGKGTEALSEEAAAAGVAEFVRPLGPVAGGPADSFAALRMPPDALVALYRSADAFVFPSHIETFGIALVEAMAAGLPIVTTDAPGCRDIVAGGRWGDVVPVGADDALAAAMARLIEDPDHAARLAEKARERACDFDWDAVVDRYIDTYRALIADHASVPV